MTHDPTALGRLHGVVRHYGWGSRTAIAELQGRAAPTELPEAELWFGAHPQAPSLLERAGERVPLDRVVSDAPEDILGASLVRLAGPRLPFLAKVLAAAEPLSLQVHPDASDAAAGFAAEEASGVPRDAPRRRYRDPWAKPEALIALTRFEAFCGVRPVDESVAVLDALGIEVLDGIADQLRARGSAAYRDAISRLLQHPTTTLVDLVERVRVAVEREAAIVGRAATAIDELAARHPSDAGVVVTVLLRHVALDAGEAIVVPPGTPHAYLRGTGLEVMGASDNVLRGGLTPKHVDVDEFCRLVVTDDVGDRRVTWHTQRDRERVLDAPGLGVRLSRPADGATLDERGPQILVCLQGEAHVVAGGATLTIGPGQAAFAPAAARDVVVRGQIHRVTVADDPTPLVDHVRRDS